MMRSINGWSIAEHVKQHLLRTSMMRSINGWSIAEHVKQRLLRTSTMRSLHRWSIAETRSATFTAYVYDAFTTWAIYR